ncbi:MAG: site-specific integrase [Candidatus Scalindua sp.]|jgi:hypothetical protein|nr:site-specific integrase [Candidatus Scalindua sp.]
MSEIAKFKIEIRDSLKSKRTYKTKSLDAYSSLLSSLLKNLKLPLKLESFTKYKSKILAFTRSNKQAIQTNKTRLSALYVMTGIEQYRELMIELCNIVNEKYKEQKMNPKQKENRITFAEVEEKVEEVRDILDEEESEENHVNYLLLAFMTGATPGIYPRRNEYANVKIKNYNKDTDNYLQGKTITFNNYKTFKKYGKQEVKIPVSLYRDVKRWLKVNDTDYLFTNKGKPFNSSTLSKRLHKIFGGIIGVNELRSIFISRYYQDMPNLKMMDDIHTAMGHSSSIGQTVYTKKD